MVPKRRQKQRHSALRFQAFRESMVLCRRCLLFVVLRHSILKVNAGRLEYIYQEKSHASELAGQDPYKLALCSEWTNETADVEY